MENGKSSEQRGFTISNLLLEGSLGVFLAVVLFVVFIIIFSDGFLTSSNFFATSRAFSLWIVVGFSQLMALVIGHLNLSAGAIGRLSAVCTGYLFQATGFPIWFVALVGIVVGVGCGRSTVSSSFSQGSTHSL